MTLRIKVILMFAVVFTSTVFADMPRTINYQGKLTDGGGSAITGPVNITFRLYNVASGGTALWSETHASLAVTNGLFDIILGESTPIALDFDEQYWIELVVGGETLNPREKLASVSYAHRAVYADTAEFLVGGGLPSGTENQTIRRNASDWEATSNLVVTSAGNVGIGTTSPDVALDIDEDGMGIPKAAEVAAAFTIDGSCFLNVLSTDDQAGILFGDAGDPDIGKLIYDNNDDAMKFSTNTSEQMRITSAGNVGIGTTTPATKLEVEGGGSTAIRGEYDGNCYGELGTASGLTRVGSRGYSSGSSSPQTAFYGTVYYGGTTNHHIRGLDVSAMSTSANGYLTGVFSNVNVTQGYRRSAITGVLHDGSYTNSPPDDAALFANADNTGGYAGYFLGGEVWIGDGGTPSRADSDGDLFVKNDLEVEGGIELGGTYRTTWPTSFPSNGITGSGTSNYVSKWTGTYTQGNSQIYDDGTNVRVISSSASAVNARFFVQGVPVTTTGTEFLAHIRLTGGSNHYGVLRLEDGGAANALGPVLEVQKYGTGPAATFTGGGVGIGSTNPGAILNIYGDGAGDGSRMASSVSSQVFIGKTGYAGSPYDSYFGQALELGYDTSSDFGFIHARNIYPSSGSGPRDLAIQSTGGNVGIGTTSPTQRVVIFNDSEFTLGGSDTGVDNLYLHDHSAGAGEGNIGASISFTGPYNGGSGAERRHAAIAGVQQTTESDYIGLAFFTHNSSVSTGDMQESMRLTHHGNLGIGTTTPDNAKIGIEHNVTSDVNRGIHMELTNNLSSSNPTFGNYTIINCTNSSNTYDQVGMYITINNSGSGATCGVQSQSYCSTDNPLGNWGLYGYASNGQNVWGAYGQATGGSSETIGVYGRGSSPTSGSVYGGYFVGGLYPFSARSRPDDPMFLDAFGIYSSGNLATSGTKSAIVRTEEGPRAVYCQESPENWFEDFGTATLSDGQSIVEIAADFLSSVTIDNENAMKVFVTPKADFGGRWWVETKSDRFILHAPEAPNGAEFDFRVVAKRKDFEELRMPLITSAWTDHFLYPNIDDVPKEYHEAWITMLNIEEWGDYLQYLSPEKIADYKEQLAEKEKRELQRK